MECFGHFYQVLHNFYIIFEGLKRWQKRRKYCVMYYTLCRTYRRNVESSRKKGTSKPFKIVTREQEWTKFIKYYFRKKGYQDSIIGIFLDLRDTSLHLLSSFKLPHPLVSPYSPPTPLLLSCQISNLTSV